MLKIGIAAGVLLAAMPAQAMVSGFYDSAEKIGMIFADERVADALRQAPVGAITNTGTSKEGYSQWEIRTQECDLLVELEPILPDGPGKTTYRVARVGSCD